MLVEPVADGATLLAVAVAAAAVPVPVAELVAPAADVATLAAVSSTLSVAEWAHQSKESTTWQEMYLHRFLLCLLLVGIEGRELGLHRILGLDGKLRLETSSVWCRIGKWKGIIRSIRRRRSKVVNR